MTRHRFQRLACVLGWLTLAGTNLAAHDGPPFPIVSNHVSGPYEVSIWSDPDTTDDGTPGGQFWVTMTPAAGGGEVPAGTTVTVAMNPAGQAERVQRGQAVPVGGRAHNQFISFVMDHEGLFEVAVEIAGPLGTGDAHEGRAENRVLGFLTGAVKLGQRTFGVNAEIRLDARQALSRHGRRAETDRKNDD